MGGMADKYWRGKELRPYCGHANDAHPVAIFVIASEVKSLQRRIRLSFWRTISLSQKSCAIYGAL